MPEYPVIRKKEIIYFIYKVTPLLSIDVDKEKVYKIFKQYILKVSNIYIIYMLYLCL